MICLALLDVDLVTDKKLILPVFDIQNTIPFTYKMSMNMFKYL